MLRVLALLLATTAVAAEPSRFFVAGDGTLAIQSKRWGERATVHYRRPDGSYDPEALARVRRIFRSGDGREGAIAVRLVEVLSHLQGMAGGAPLSLLSGYRSPTYNEGLRAKGRKAAGGSLHTEGLAADVALPRARLPSLWQELRDLDCCGAGLYQQNGFMHVDVGRPRFWEAATSGVEKNLSAGNARLFARTEYDRYAAGEPIVVTLHALTEPPVRIAREAEVRPENGSPIAVRVDGDAGEREGCVELAATGSRLRVTGAHAGRGRLVLQTCAPRVAATPEVVEANVVEVRP